MKTASLENSKALVERGVRLETYFGYQQGQFGPFETPAKPMSQIFKPCGYIPAPTFEEIAELLKPLNITWRWNMVNEFEAYCQETNNEYYALSPADTASEVLCDALDNGHLKVEEINAKGAE